MIGCFVFGFVVFWILDHFWLGKKIKDWEDKHPAKKDEPVVEKKPEPKPEPVVEKKPEPVVENKPEPVVVPVVVEKKPEPKPESVAVTEAAATKDEPEKFVLFTLSRVDIFDHIKAMDEDKERYPAFVFVKKRPADSDKPDYYLSGGKCYAIVLSRAGNIHSLILHMSEKMASKFREKHTIAKAKYLGDNWYYLALDEKVFGKPVVYSIMDECYDYTAKQSSGADEKSLKSAQTALEKLCKQNGAEILANYEAAEAEYNKLFEPHKRKNPIITTPEMVAQAKELGIKKLTVKVHPELSHVPVSLKIGKTYALLPGEGAVPILKLHINEEHAEKLAATHPGICRTGFPNGANWYKLPLDSGFKSKEAVFRTLDEAREYVKSQSVKK